MREAGQRQITRRTALKWGALAVSAPALSQFPFLDVLAATEDSVVLKWNAAALQGVRDSKIGPPMVARALAIVHTCIFDAWAAYNNHALGTRLGAALRRPSREHTLANTNMAVSFAAYGAAVDLFPGTKGHFDQQMIALGYDPNDPTTDPTTPVGVGKLAADAVLDFRHHDGANQLGDEPGGRPGVAYSDYSGYVSPNQPMDLRHYPTCADPTRNAFVRSAVVDPNQWQPLLYIDQAGKDFLQPGPGGGFIGAQWNRVKPFALTSASQLRSAIGPPRFGSDRFRSQHEALVELSAGLTDEQKMIAEYWADGPHSELPPGHWDLFAQFVSRRDHHGDRKHGVAADVKLFFALTNAIFDASICCWDNKRAFGGVRPITAIRYLFQGQQIRSWGGPCEGTRPIPGEAWLPYQPSFFPTPPFPGYSSGHSTFSAAGAEILKLFTGSDRMGDSVTLPAGSSRTEPGTPTSDVTLRWATFSDAAAQAGISRRLGGIHIEQDDLDGRAAGRLVARQAWTKAQSYINGSASTGQRE